MNLLYLLTLGKASSKQWFDSWHVHSKWLMSENAQNMDFCRRDVKMYKFFELMGLKTSIFCHFPS